jgi:hypothetical protein
MKKELFLTLSNTSNKYIDNHWAIIKGFIYEVNKNDGLTPYYNETI